MKRSALMALVTFLVASMAAESNAQTSLGVNVGYNLDVEEVFLGGQLRFDPPALPVIINPSIETYFVDGTLLQIDANALYPIGSQNVMFTPHIGAGLGLAYAKPEDGDGETEFGLNLVAGATFGFARIQPFAEARIQVGGMGDVSIRGGLLFGL